jgi:hypothetical protein
MWDMMRVPGKGVISTGRSVGKQSMGAPGLAFETWDPGNEFILGTRPLFSVRLPQRTCDLRFPFVLTIDPVKAVAKLS